jgi:hypothetical protein
MLLLRWLGFACGVLIVAGSAWSLVYTLVVPRRVQTRLPFAVSKIVRAAFGVISSRAESYEGKDRILALQAPLTFLLMLVAWLVLFLVGYAFVLLPLSKTSIGEALTESGSSMLTLGIAARFGAGPVVVYFIAGATGLGVVALLIGYLPTLYASFNRRETLVTTLQSRAGAPAWGPEILARHQLVGLLDSLPAFYAEWERWSADVAESHANYPVLVSFRSPHPLRSWVVALLAVLDSAALYLALCPQVAPSEARLCLRMGFLCLREIAGTLGITFDPDPLPEDPLDITFEEFRGGIRRLEETGFPMERSPEEAWPHFRGWRVNYEAVAYALADHTLSPPGPWSGGRTHLPDLAILPQRPVDRKPGDRDAKGIPKAARTERKV